MNKYLEEDRIDLRNLFNVLWKEKTLILITVILTFLSFYLYSLSLPRQYRTEIIIQNPPRQIFYEYRNFGIPITIRNEIDVDRTIQKEFIILNLNEQFMHDFNLNISSISNLDVFLNQNKEKEFDNFQVFLKKKKISAFEYFKSGRFGQVRNKNQTIENFHYFLIFPDELKGPVFLNNYVEFIKNKTLIEFANALKKLISFHILKLEHNLDLAKKIQLEVPLEMKVNHYVKYSNNNDTVNNNDKELYFKGTKILIDEINYYKKMLERLDDLSKFDYNPILKKADDQVFLSQNLLFLPSGFIFGFFLSLLIVFFKNILKR